MSRLPSIPEFANTPDEIGNALRVTKQVVEQLAGQRQGESKGAPQVFVQPTEPSRALALNLKAGDLWIDTSSNVLRFWSGTAWQAFA